MSISPHNKELLKKYEYYLDNNVNENKKSSNTKKAYYTDIVQFLKYLGDMDVEMAEYEDAVDWLYTLKGRGENGASVASKNRKKASIRAFSHYLKSKHIIENDPFILLTPETIIKGEEGNQIVRDILDEIEIVRFRKALDKEVEHPTKKKGNIEANLKMNALRWKALFNLMLETGMRVGEVCSLERYQVKIDKQKGTYYIYIPKSKNKNRKKSRNIPIPKTVVDYIKEYKESIPFTPDNDYVFVSQTGEQLDRNIISIKLKEYAEIAKINKDLTPHSLRHTFASYKLNVEKVPSTVVAAWMGHTSGTMLEKVYYHQETMSGECAI